MQNQYDSRWDDNLLEQMKKYGEALVSINEIVDIFELSGEDEKIFREVLKNHKTSKLYKAYHKNRAETIALLKAQNVDLAKRGSQIALNQVKDYIKQTEI